MMPVRKVEHAVLLPLPSGEQGQLLEHVDAARLPALEDLVLGPRTRFSLNRVLAEHREVLRLKERGLRPANRLLFRGPPGTGKTATAGALAAELGVPFVKVRQDALVQSYMGKTSASMRLVFDFAATTRSVMLIDEVDAIARSREKQGGSESASAEGNRIVTSLLVMLEEHRHHSDTIVIAATNHEGVIDRAMWRRFDEVISFEMPTQDAAVTLLCQLLHRHGHSVMTKGAIAQALGRRLRGLSFADVERIALDAIKTILVNDQATMRSALEDAVGRQRTRRALTSNMRRGKA
jgi:SpoVK/Ycf46/Vps4 family AAA+-type ATPase